MLATRGFKIVRLLLLTYDEYKRNGVTARKMQPAAIFVDSSFEYMTFTDLEALAFHKEPVYYFPEPIMPYNN